MKTLRKLTLTEVDRILFDLYPDLRNTDLSGMDLSGWNLTNANFTGTNLNGANLEGANLMYTIFRNANLEGANLSKVYGHETVFEGANLVGVNFTDADLWCACFRNANLEGVNLEIASNICYGNFIGANLKGIRMTAEDKRLVDEDLEYQCRLKEIQKVSVDAVFPKNKYADIMRQLFKKFKDEVARDPNFAVMNEVMVNRKWNPRLAKITFTKVCPAAVYDPEYADDPPLAEQVAYAVQCSPEYKAMKRVGKAPQ